MLYEDYMVGRAGRAKVKSMLVQGEVFLQVGVN